MLTPNSSAELAAAVAGCRNPLGVIEGWGTPWSRAKPSDLEVEVSLASMDRLLVISPEDLTCRVEVGIAHSALTNVLDQAELEWPLDPLPGHLLLASTYLSGAARARSGIFANPRDWILGSTLVSGRGELVTSGGATLKNSAGYDLGRSFFASMGLAVIPAQLQLRLRRRPERRASLISRPLNGSGYRNLLARLRGHLAVVERVEVFAGDGPPEALVTLGGPVDRIEPAVVDLADLAAPVDRLPPDPTGVLGEGSRLRIPIREGTMANLLDGRPRTRFCAFPLQRIAYLSAARKLPALADADQLLLPLADPAELRGPNRLLFDGLDPEQRLR